MRARNESESIKLFITGSSANLMSRELATLLTGRHVNFHVTPLSFAEYLQVLKREQEALTEMKQHHNGAKSVLVTAKMPKKTVEMCMPLWLILLNDTPPD